ncbi:MAG TPA: tetratricopeptide repeat protein [Xanthomonadaceae bacterium]|nr:tetratricopeptide repeat protein [Xanthomonadaceae bacterium]
MEQYTDDERVEDLKKWWKENGASIMAGIALGLIAIFGWQYWLSYRDAKAEQASQAYDAFGAAVEKADADQVRQRGQALLTDFPKSPYATLAALRLAKLAADGGDIAAARQRLEWVIDHARLDELKDIARLRLARVLFAAGQPAEAEQRLAQVTTASLTAEREELRGDLALAGNDAAKARTAYAAALAAGGGTSLLQLKLDNLAPPSAQAVVVAPATPPAAAQPKPAESAPDTPGTDQPASGKPADESAPPALVPAFRPETPAESATPVTTGTDRPDSGKPVSAEPTPAAASTTVPDDAPGTVPAPAPATPTAGQ